MEEKLFTILTNRLVVSPQYFIQVTSCLAQFLEFPVTKVCKVGYGQPSLFPSCQTNHSLVKQIDDLFPNKWFDHGTDRLSDADIYAIEQLFEGGVKMRREYFGDNSPFTKGYAFRIEYYFETIRDVRSEAEAMLNYAYKVLQNESVQNTILEKRKDYDKRQAELEQKEKEREAEVKRKYDEEHTPKYLAILERAKTITVPKKKKDALKVEREDFDSLVYAIWNYTYESYPFKESSKLRSAFQSIKVWMPNDILHCLDEQDNEYILFRNSWITSLRAVTKKPKKES
jgi:hypothetical protein